MPEIHKINTHKRKISEKNLSYSRSHKLVSTEREIKSEKSSECTKIKKKNRKHKEDGLFSYLKQWPHFCLPHQLGQGLFYQLRAFGFLFIFQRAENAAGNFALQLSAFCRVSVCVCVWQVNYPVAKLNCHKQSANIVCVLKRIKHTQREPAVRPAAL